MATDDMELVRQYVADQSESAFAEIVSRHTNLVYSASLRLVRDPQLAGEITQVVFIILARKAGSLNERTIVPSWLYRAACYTSNSALKRERRRQQREQEAYMQSTLNETGEDAAWEQIAPLLEEGMLRLSQADRDALVLRFFEKRSLNEVGAALGASEEAAKKRVNRALEKLRKFFSKRGVVSTATIIAGAISTNSVHAAPTVLAKTVTAIALAKGATASVPTLALIKGAMKLMAWTQAKTAVAIAAAALLTAGTTTVVLTEIHSPTNAAPAVSVKDPADMMAAYRKAVGATVSDWSRYHYLRWADPAFQGRLATLLAQAGGVESLRSGQKAGLTNELMFFFRAYSTGTYDAYKAFRMPAGVPFELQQTNRLGPLADALQNEKTIAQPKAFDRWDAEIKGKSIDWASKPVEEQFLAYLKLYSGNALFSNYLAGVAFDQSRIVVTQFQAGPIPLAVHTSFASSNAAQTIVGAPTSFPNMGYMSQQAYTFIKFKDSMEDTRLKEGVVTVADCVLFCDRTKPDSPLPVIVRLYWEPKTARWLPADVVICNMADKGDFWPIF